MSLSCVCLNSCSVMVVGLPFRFLGDHISIVLDPALKGGSGKNFRRKLFLDTLDAGSSTITMRPSRKLKELHKAAGGREPLDLLAARGSEPANVRCAAGRAGRRKMFDEHLT